MIAIVRYAPNAARVLCGVLLVASSCAAQQPSSTVAPASLRTSVPAKTQPKRIWTDENIAQVRTAADTYQDQKEAAAEETRKRAAEQAALAAQKDFAGPPENLTIPKTEAEIAEAIDLRRGWLENCQSILLNTRQRLSEATDPVLRKTLEEKAQLIEQDIATISREIQVLEKAKSALQHPQEK